MEALQEKVPIIHWAKGPQRGLRGLASVGITDSDPAVSPVDLP